MTFRTLLRWTFDKVACAATRKPGLTEIGITKPYCPHCAIPFPKMPGSKSTCRACSAVIYGRKRPIDNAKALFRPDQLPELDEQWAVKNGLWGTFQQERAEMEAVKKEIRSTCGHEPSSNDVLWGIYNRRKEAAARRSQWFSYQLTHFRMANLLLSEQKYTAATRHFSIYVYLGINGARNPVPDKDGNPRTRCWDPDTQLLVTPGIKALNRAIALANLNESEVHSSYLGLCATYYGGCYGIPMTPSESWEKIRPELDFR